LADRIRIVKAKRAGFCFGVKRAVDIAFDAASKSSHVFTLGPVIHNPQVIERLKAQGVAPIESINNRKIKTLIIRTHGVTKEISEQLVKKTYSVIDATCPFVKKAQHYAGLLRDEGYQVVIIGDKEHPEVIGLMSYAGPDCIVINKETPVPKLRSRVGVVVQTTQPVTVLKRFIGDSVDQVKELKVFNTICNSTALRLKETKRIAKDVDVVIVVGGKNSANTTQLAKFCISMSVPTYHIETAKEIKKEWFADVENVGITAGASTPDWIIEEVADRIRYIGGCS
jgi:4-hydroxy-3-methylbut-2-en-1-yl diphosphate reductase